MKQDRNMARCQSSKMEKKVVKVNARLEQPWLKADATRTL